MFMHTLELVNDNQTEPPCFLFPYKHPTNVVIHLIKIIILGPTNVLPVNVGYKINGKSVSCLRCSNCYVCSMICGAPLSLQHVTFATPFAISHHFDFDKFFRVSSSCVTFFFFFLFFVFLSLVIHGLCA